MARAWFFNIPHHGHINPTLPLVQELCARGDEVTYFAGRLFEDRILATGADFRDYGEIDAFKQSRRAGHAIQQGSLVAEATHALLPAVLEAVEEERPDYLLFDMSAPWAGIAGRQASIPAIVVFPHLPFYWRTITRDRRVFRKVLNSVRPGQGYWRDLQRQAGKMVKDLGLRRPQDLNVLSSSAGLNIVFTSRYFQPFQERFDETYCFIGPVVDLEREEQPIVLHKGAAQKLIYIAVGTVYQAKELFFRQCIEAFSDPQYAVVMSVGRSVEPEALEPIPVNFTVGQFMPQMQVLREADLFITHGGMNSISEAAILEVPMIVVPNTLEQTVNASRVEQLRAGLYIPPNDLSVEKLRSAAHRVLNSAVFADGLDRIKRSYQASGGVELGADTIERFKQDLGLH